MQRDLQDWIHFMGTTLLTVLQSSDVHGPLIRFGMPQMDYPFLLDFLEHAILHPDQSCSLRLENTS